MIFLKIMKVGISCPFTILAVCQIERGKIGDGLYIKVLRTKYFAFVSSCLHKKRTKYMPRCSRHEMLNYF